MKRRLSGYFLLYALLYVIAGFLLLYNLSDRLMWGDEAETAILAKNITRFNLPLARDGKNSLAIFPPAHVETNRDFVWTWSPWLAPYLAAISFKLLGPTTFAARLPFVIIAFFAIVLMKKVATSFYKNDETALVACLLLATSVPFLLHSRQCRYYALLGFTQLCIVYGYHKMSAEKGWRGSILLTLALVAQFYTNYISFAGNCLALAAHVLFVAPKKKELLLRLLPCAAVSAGAIAPWVVYSDMLGKSDFISTSRVWSALTFYVSETNFHIVPVIVFVLPLVMFAVRKIRGENVRWSPETSLLVAFVLGQLMMLALVVQIYFRYLMAPLPLLILLESRAITWSVKQWWPRVLILTLLVCTNLFGLISLFPFRGEHRPDYPLPRFVHEITSKYDDMLENVVTFFLTNAKPSESVFVMEVESPLVFYTGMRVIDGRFPENAAKLSEADWLLTESPSSVIKYNTPLVLNIPPAELPRYEALTLRVRNTPLGASRPDPDIHRSFTAKNFKDIIIYRRRY